MTPRGERGGSLPQARTRRSVLDRLRGAVVLPSDAEPVKREALRPGELILDALARAGVTDVDCSFTETHDSHGRTWPVGVSSTLKPGCTVLAILRDLDRARVRGREAFGIPDGQRFAVIDIDDCGVIHAVTPRPSAAGQILVEGYVPAEGVL